MIRIARFAGFTVMSTYSMCPTVFVKLSPGSRSAIVVVVRLLFTLSAVLVLDHGHEVVNFGVELGVLFFDLQF